ncbi:MAG: RES family NAD+ phosphorylase [Betaproteobacteria bacterium]|nr:RES family NAD+ phosphorylase [Betaproteobacteria bacterium]
MPEFPEIVPTPLSGTLLRLVESQEQIATSRIADGLAEQALLEALLESSKPPLPKVCEPLHYLLKTPFRYPPLRHGSRFGSRTEPAIFYGAQTRDTVLAESAYYRFVFWHGMVVAPSKPLTTQHTLFSVAYRSKHGVQLQAPPFDALRAALTDPADYRSTQALGARMRDAGVIAFEFVSARDTAGGINVGLFQPAALADTRPHGLQEWWCETAASQVRFYSKEASVLQTFPRANFLHAGRLPLPAL